MFIREQCLKIILLYMRVPQELLHSKDTALWTDKIAK